MFKADDYYYYLLLLILVSTNINPFGFLVFRDSLFSSLLRFCFKPHHYVSAYARGMLFYLLASLNVWLISL